jgi:DNA-binding protein YbaB
MSAPVDFGLQRLLESTQQALNMARGGQPDAADAPEPPVGRGSAADGQVRVEAHTGGRLANLEIDPRMMRQDSVTLSAAIVTAANAALADLQTQLRTSLGSTDVAAVAERLKEVQQESVQQMTSFLSAIGDMQARIAAAARPS